MTEYHLAPVGEQGNARVKIREVLDTLYPLRPPQYNCRPGPHKRRGPKPGSHWSQRDAPRNNTTGGRAQR